MALYKRDIIEIRRLRANATAKIARARRTYQINLSGTEFDPRKSPSVDALRGMSRKELNAYKDSLRQFNSRSNNIHTKIIAGANGRPFTKSVWSEYKDIESQFNNVNNARYARYNDVMSPAGMDYQTRMAMRKPISLDTDVNLSYYGTSRDIKGFLNDKSVRKRADVLRKRMEPDYYDKRFKAYKANLIEMLELDPVNRKYVDDIKDMNIDQFTLISDLPGIWDKVAWRYEKAKKGEELPTNDYYDIGDEISHVLNKAYPELRRNDAQAVWGK